MTGGYIMNKTSKKFKDPGSAITHLIAMIGAVICAFPLIGKAVHTNKFHRCFCHECIYQQHDSSLRSKHPLPFFRYFKKGKSFLPEDVHSMIFVLIAGSYTPVCLLALDRKQGIPLLVLVWATAIIGIIIKIFFINCPHWVALSSISEWAGHVYLSSSHSLPICQPVHLHGSLPEASFTLSAVLSTD